MRCAWKKKLKFLTVVGNLETSESRWFGRERQKETLGTFTPEEEKIARRSKYPRALQRSVGPERADFGDIWSRVTEDF